MAYDLSMQINLQKPSPTNLTEIRNSIEKGLKGINVGAAIRSATAGKPIKIPITPTVFKKDIDSIKQSIALGLGKTPFSVGIKASKQDVKTIRSFIQSGIGTIPITTKIFKSNVTDIRKTIIGKIGVVPITIKVFNSNIKQIRQQIQAGLQNITVSVNTTGAGGAGGGSGRGGRGGAGGAGRGGGGGGIGRQAAGISQSLRDATDSGNSFFDAITGKARSFAAYAVASTAILKLSGAVSNATNEAIKYEKELINIAQTTGDSIERTKSFSDALVDISTKYNVNLSQVAKLTRTLAQAGLSFSEASKGAEILARTSLLAGFDSLTSTTEGLIAVMSTFNLTVTSAGKVLESINAVSKAYAVESTDLVESIKRTGGAFSVAGGTVEELIALITAVRSTTRESAETISTGFRTIFGRLQRPKTIEYFKKLGIELEDAEGKFIGPYQSIIAINKGLEQLGITTGTVKFAEVVEQIGGIRQISKVVPLLTQTKKAQEALNVANNASEESIKDLEKAQQGLGYKLGTLQKEFAALISEVVDSKGFKTLADIFIGLSKSVIQFTSTLKPLMSALAPIMGAVAGRVLGQSLQGKGFSETYGSGRAAARRRNRIQGRMSNIGGLGGAAGPYATSQQQDVANFYQNQLNAIPASRRGRRRYASGGTVPGSGSGDTVPAMLTPGEFVINKKSAQAIGYSNLAKINKYADGGLVEGKTTKEAYLYHASNSGKDNRVIESLLKGGARSDIAHGYGQGSGFYLYTNVQKAYDHALGLSDPTALTGAEQGGKPFVAWFVEKLTPKRWNLDYEYNSPLVTKWITDNYDQLKRYLEGQKIDHPEFPSQLPAITVKGITQQNKGISLEVADKSGRTQLDEVLSNQSGNVKTGRYLGQIISHLRNNDPNIVYNFEGWALENVAEKKFKSDIKGIKYVGKEPLKPFSIQTYDEANDFWRTVKNDDWSLSKFAKGGAVGTDTVPAMLTPGEYVINKKSAQAFGYGNLEKVNRYAKGGIVSGVQKFAEGGSVKRSWMEFFGFTKSKNPMQDDLSQGGGELIHTFDDLKKAVESVTADMGDAGKEILKQIKLSVRPAIINGRLFAGAFRPSTGKIDATPGRADQVVAAHEVGHASDYLMGGSRPGTERFPLVGRVGAERYASGQQGTLQNKLAKAAQQRMYIELKARGASEKEIQHRLNLQEVYADLFSKSKPAVRAILASTTNAREGMKQLADLLENEPEQYNRLFMGIENDIPSLRKARKRGLQALQDAAIGAEIEKEKQLEAAKQAAAAAEEAKRQAAISEKAEKDRQRALEIERKNNVKRLRSEGTITGKRAKEGLQTEESKAIGGQIREESQRIQTLSKTKSDAQSRVEQLPKTLESLKASVQTGVLSQQRYNQIAKQTQAQIRKEQELITKIDQQITESEKNRAELRNQYKASQQKSRGLLYSASNAPPNLPKGGGPGGPGGPDDPGGGPVGSFLTTIGNIDKQMRKLNITFIEMAVYAQTFASTFGSAISQFFEGDFKQEVLSAATARGGVLSATGEAAEAALSRKNAFLTGKALGKLPGGLGRFGQAISNNAGRIAAAGKAFGRAFDIFAKVELVGGLFDAILSVNYAAQRDKFIQLGDASKAAEAATRAYAQEQLRAIPILGGFISGLGGGMNATEENLDSLGRLVVGNARLAASVINSQKEFTRLSNALDEARSSNDGGAAKEIIGNQLKSIENLDAQAFDLFRQAQMGAKTNKNAPGYTGAGMGIGGTLGSIAGGVAGSFVGGPAGAAGGAALGGKIGTAVGGFVGLGVGAYMDSQENKAKIAESYQVQIDAIKQSSQNQINMIKDVSASLKSESARIIDAGGSYEDALKNIADRVGGKDILTKIMAGEELTGDIQKDLEALRAQRDAGQKRIDTLKAEKATIKDSDKVAVMAKEREIQLAQVRLDAVDTIETELQTIQYNNIQQERLLERRKVESAAIKEQIRIMKQLETAYDGFNATMRDINDTVEQMGNVGTGRLSTRRAASRVGIDDSRMFEMSPQEIMRTPEVATAMATYATAAGAPGGEINRALISVDQLNRLNKFAETKEFQQLRQSAVEGENRPSAQELEKDIMDLFGFDESNPIIKNAIRTYAERLLSNSDDVAGAGQAAKEEAEKQAIEIISRQQEKFKELIQTEQKYREGQIELINRRAEDAKRVYEAEKEYFDERLSLNTKVREALQIEPAGPGRSSFLQTQAASNRAARMGNLSANRGRLGIRNVDESINNVSRLMEFGKRAAEQQAAEKGEPTGISDIMPGLKNDLEILQQTIRDEIDIQNQYLDGLIDSAKAQQEYTQALYDAQGAIVRDLVTGTDEDVAKQLRGLNAAAIASMQGSFAGVPEDLKQEVFSIFDQFADIEIPGLGKTGRQAQREITKNEMMKRFGVDAATAEQLASKAVQDRVPIDQRMADQIENQRKIVEGLITKEHDMKQKQIEMEISNTTIFGQHVDRLGIRVDQLINELGMSRQNFTNPPQQIPDNVRPMNNMAQNVPAASNQPIQLVTNGQQEFTLRLPDMQMAVNQAITSTIYDAISTKFKNLADGIRTANNFEDAANIIQTAASQTETLNIGGQV
jgi:TP901 family phage tail tape measure protein